MSEVLKLWFFRDLSDEQRLKLFSLFDLPVDEIGDVHGRQTIALRHIVQKLIKMVGDEAAPAEQLMGGADEFRLAAEAKLMRQKAISNARERNAAERRVAELEAALKPFADEAGAYDPDTGDGDDTCWAAPAYFKIRDLRRARAVLTSKEDADG